ncbi:RluA family pseudouridine synthase [Candidatus Saccharibacteria bacterium]|nr:RluA family pseudouridine synthase [Candidatus Saccharibacteria bacterium]
MVKVSSSDALAILRRFEVAGDENVPRHISMVTFTNPSPTNTLVSFRFAKQQYYILFDDTAEDNVDFVMKQIRTDKQDAVGEVIENPNDHSTSYALPFKGKEVYLFVAKSPKTRLDLELATRFPEISRSTWQKHVKAGHVSVNGEVQLSPKHDIISIDSIAVAIPDAIDFSKNELPIIYIDDNVIVINKPIGVLSHSKGAMNDEFTVADFFRRYSNYNADTNRPGIIHRLDRDTSGVMIGARNAETATLLQKQFADRKTKKIYLAIVDGVPKAMKAQIDLPIGRNPSAPSTFKVDVKGKAALTKYEVIGVTDTSALVKLYPRTGRTHQLRVHMKYINTPVMGDKVYGKAADRLYLHAASLEITIPVSDRRIFEAPIPKEFIDKFPQAK